VVRLTGLPLSQRTGRGHQPHQRHQNRGGSLGQAWPGTKRDRRRHFIAWADADQRDQRELADFYIDRFRPEFKTAFDAWTATNPLTS
jgi:hypothetical protein